MTQRSENTSVLVSFSCYIRVTVTFLNHFFPATHTVATVFLFLGLLVKEGGALRLTDHVPGILKVTVIKAYNLPDTDGLWDTADPYARITAHSVYGFTVSADTRVIEGNLNPVWNQEVNLQYESKWTHFTIQIWDQDGGLNGNDDTMTGEYRVDVVVPCSDVEKVGGKIEYSYYVDYSL